MAMNMTSSGVSAPNINLRGATPTSLTTATDTIGTIASSLNSLQQYNYTVWLNAANTNGFTVAVNLALNLTPGATQPTFDYFNITVTGLN